MRAPWTEFPDGDLPAISDALLDAVAAPRHKPLRVRMRFADDALDAAVPVLESPLLAQCSYIIGMLDVTGGEAPDATPDAPAADADSSANGIAPLVPLPPPYTRDDWRDLQRVIAGKEPEIGAAPEPTSEEADASDAAEAALPAFLRSPAAYEARIAALVDLADYLGVPAGATAQLRAAGAGGGRNRADEMRVDMAWGRAAMHAARRAEDGVLDDVDAALAATLRHTPLLQDAPNDDRWVMHTVPRARSGVAPGTCVLKPNPVAAALESLPELVLTALRNEAGHLALAGGAALAAVAAPEILERESLRQNDYDFDFFVYDLHGDATAKAAAADGIVRRVYGLFKPDTEYDRDSELHVVKSHNAVTLFISDSWCCETVVQIILRIAKSPADILAGFDLAPAKVLITFEPSPTDPFSPQLKVMAAPDWSLAMRHGAFALDGLRWSRATALRVFKYHAKGFDALIPVLRDRRKIRYTMSGKQWWRASGQKLKHYDGFELLFAIERHIPDMWAGDERMARWQHSFRLRGTTDAKEYEAPPPHRVRMRDVQRVTRALRMAQRSDYATALTTMRRWFAVVWWAGAAALQRLGIISVPEEADKLAAPLAWRQPWSAAQFHPVNVDVLDALNLVDAAK